MFLHSNSVKPVIKLKEKTVDAFHKVFAVYSRIFLKITLLNLKKSDISSMRKKIMKNNLAEADF